MSRFTPLRNALDSKGWEITLDDVSDDYWWAYEIWLLRSSWSPIGKCIYLILLVDPLWEGDFNNVPDTAVWAVGLSDYIPADRPSGEIWEYSVKKQYSEMIQQTLEQAADMRVSA